MYSPRNGKVCAAAIGLLLAVIPALQSAAHAADPAQTAFQASPDTLVVRSMSELLDLVDRRNPELDVSRLETRALDAEANAIQPLPDPTAGLTLFPAPIHTARGEQQFQLRAEQMIPWPGKIGLDRSLTRLRAEASTESTREMSLDLRSASLDRVVVLARIDALESAIVQYALRLEDLERVSSVRYEVGQGPQSAIVKSQVERSVLDLQTASLAGARESALADLEALVDAPLAIDFDPSGAIAAATAGAGDGRVSSDSLLSIALNNRPAFERLRIMQRRSGMAVDRARLNFRPDFGVGITWFGIAESDMPPSSDGRDALGAGFTVRIPLYRDQKQAHVERARLSALQTDEAMRDLVASTRSDIEKRLADIHSASEQLELYRTSLIPRAELAAATSLKAYESGRASYLDLLDAERTLFRLRLDRIETEARLRHHVVRLERLLGRTPSTF